MTLAVLGGSGFLGTAVLAAARAQDLACRAVPAPRIGAPTSTPPAAAARRWAADHPDEHDRLVHRLRGSDVVVNAAGLALPGSATGDALHGANAVLPVVLAAAAAEAGVRRLVHLSSAAVQGRRDPLDETTAHAATSPYARSKAAGETALLRADPGAPRPAEVVVFRPTSVHGPGRATTRSLVRLLRLPGVPVAGDGAHPVPLALVDDVAAGVLLLATCAAPPTLAVHPWDGMTTGLLLQLLAPHRRHPRLPEPAVRTGLAALRAAAVTPAGSAWSRRLDLLLLGPRVEARELTALGYRPALRPEAWEQLAAAA